MTKPFDLKHDPKFLQRINQLQSKAFTRVLKDPVYITFSGGAEGYVVAIGINGSYLVTIPRIKLDGTHAWSYGDALLIWWSDKPSPAFDLSEVSKWMSMWLITSTDDDYELVRHRDLNTVKVAIAGFIKKRGIEYFDNGRSVVHISVQGIPQDIPNPYVKPR